MIAAVAKLAGPDYFILIAYFTLMLGIGIYFYQYMEKMKDFFSGGNQIPWWLSGVSFYMASFSAFAFIYYSSVGYMYGWVAITLFWVTVPATLIGVLLFAKRWRRARITSPVEYLESRYSSTIRQLFAWHGIPVRIVDDSLKLIAISMFLSVGLGIKPTAGIFWAGAIMTAYTFMGGLWAVAVTDFVQFVVLAAAITILLPLSIVRAGGISHMLHNAPPNFFHWTSAEYDWRYVACAVLLYAISFSSLNWALIQRYFCVPRERDALKVGWLVVVLYIVGTPIMFLPAIAGRFFLPEIVGPDFDTKQVYPMVCAQVLPVGMLGLIIAAMFSSTMSALSSHYNVCANVLTIDVYQRLFRPKATQRELVFIGRAMTLVVGFLCMGIAFLLVGGKDDSQFRYMVTLFSIATAPVGLPMLLGILSRRTTNYGALAGFLVGMAVGLGIFLAYPDKMHVLGSDWPRENIILLATTVTTLASMVVVSRLFPRSAAEAERTDAFLNRLQIPVGQLPEDQHLFERKAGGKVVSPFRVVGICVLIIGLMMLGILPWADTHLARMLDLGIGGVLAVLGGVVVWQSGRASKPQAQAAEELISAGK
jgi:solute:Na+ symporter, SSS family